MFSFQTSPVGVGAGDTLATPPWRKSKAASGTQGSSIFIGIAEDGGAGGGTVVDNLGETPGRLTASSRDNGRVMGSL